ncbi:MAG: Ppx/GppA phosphatase family protein [Syntrophomonadaceae bacterium]|nr:Ppx/GppA phosphatase family protein [Syntrophomonadaceae bacterium]MDD3023140.1 Ppx/GppA phosphatase family protein [Syntrophomonadaceae bacterium]
MKYAAIDIGTNSCRLLIASMQKDRLTAVCKRIETTRLGEGLKPGGKISVQAIERSIKCLEDFKSNILEHQVQSFRAVATSALREAANGQELLDEAKDRLDLNIEIIDGEEEAELSYQGVMSSLQLDNLPLVVDLGGGSTEFIIKGDKSISLSLPVGAVRASENDMKAVDIAAALAPLSGYNNILLDNPLVFVGGTATTLVAIKNSFEVYDSKLVHGQILKRVEIADIYNMLERMSLKLRKRLPGLQPERADIIPKGTMIVLLIMDLLAKEKIIVSDCDLLEGMVWRMHLVG